MTARPDHSGVITSAANPAITFVRSLGRRDRRIAEGAFIVEGVRAVRDALEVGATPRLLLWREGSQEHDFWREFAHAGRVSPRVVAPTLFDRLSDVQTPQGVLAVFPFPRFPPVLNDEVSLVLVLDRLRDPGNLGTLLRAAAGAGVDGVYLSPETVDPWNPKVVRAAMGAHFRIPLRPFDVETQERMRENLPRRVITSATATLPYDAVDWTGPAALVVGGEAEGVSPEVAAWGTEMVGIPLAHDVESLNAAVAGAVILFEAARQRRVASTVSVVSTAASQSLEHAT